MTYSSDDYTSSSSQAPFAGDQTGDIFQEPDNFVAQSPITTVRMVETQSGFLVVLKDVEDRVSLAVKRKIGTPPASQVLLTGDESLKLSRILGGSKSTQIASEHGYSDYGDYRVSDSLERTASATDAIQTLTADTHQTTDFSDLNIPERKRRQSLDSPRRAKEKKYLMIGGVGFMAVTLLAIGSAVFFLVNNNGSKVPGEVVKGIARSEMTSESVDTFVRTFVANLLDFNPRSYRYSQVQAMAVMKPDLMKKYWNETSFPLSRNQLKRLPKNQNVIINKVVQAPTSSVTTDVDLYAEMVNQESKKPTPIHLRLGISLNSDGNLVVASQKDVSSEDKEKQGE